MSARVNGLQADLRILIVDDDIIIRDSLYEFLTVEGFTADRAKDIKGAKTRLAQRDYALVLIDVNLPDGDGLELVEWVHSHHPSLVLVMTAYGTIESAVRAIKLGATNYLTKPIRDDQLREQVTQAMQSLQQSQQYVAVQRNEQGFDHILSQDRNIKRIFSQAKSVADSDATILITGPSGSGKSMVARAIHCHSRRQEAPFIEVSCGALPETLLESELFGHMRGAFTGAVSNKKGKFLAAGKGTIFLDEIGTASPALQLKLLRILQERRFEPVGSNKTQVVKARILLATNCDLPQEVSDGRFREDLFYRINVITVEMPSLRDRTGDIPLLATHFLHKSSVRHNRPHLKMTDESLRILEAYDWPGNIRELENVIERAVLLAQGPNLWPEDLPHSVRKSPVNQGRSHAIESLKTARAEPEKRLIREALKANHWNRTKTASILEINRTTLYKKMKKYRLDVEAREFEGR
jgi:two-component system, NtrC family, response regulator AtoC